MHQWQSLVEMKIILSCISIVTAFEGLQHWTSIKGGVCSCFVGHARYSCVYEVRVKLTFKGSSVIQCLECDGNWNMWCNNLHGLPHLSLSLFLLLQRGEGRRQHFLSDPLDWKPSLALPLRLTSPAKDPGSRDPRPRRYACTGHALNIDRCTSKKKQHCMWLKLRFVIHLTRANE